MSNQPLIKINNHRELNFYIAYLRCYSIFPPIIKHDNLKLASEALSNTLSKTQINRDFILDMQLTYDKVILPEESFDWLDEDKRALFYFWGCLKFNKYLNDFINKLMPLPSDNWYEKANITSSSFNHKERLILMMSFFDFLCIEKRSIEPANTLMQSFHETWDRVHSNVLWVSWLSPEDKEGCQWAYNYLLDYQIKNKPEEDDPLFPVKLPTPKSAEEFYYSFYAMHDLWSEPLETSRVNIEKMNKAWAQRKYRAKKSQSKLINHLNAEDRQALNMLCEHYQKTEMDIITMLIQDRATGITTRNSQPKR
ncbi:hypothetical protein [Providencia sp. PROV033]|uniref:hypothetical protein n=1 Tax=Providencia sp. PROV033 TaxID=2949765 RepID=UPI002349879F|nr:hypothetical protein [Providencia sp. PROV033]